MLGHSILFPASHGTRRFNTEFTTALHLFLSLTRPIQSTSPHPTSPRSILILSTHLRLSLPSGLFPSEFPPIIYTRSSSPPFVLHGPPISSASTYYSNYTWRRVQITKLLITRVFKFSWQGTLRWRCYDLWLQPQGRRSRFLPETLAPFDKSTPHHNSDNRERNCLSLRNHISVLSVTRSPVKLIVGHDSESFPPPFILLTRPLVSKLN
jgi:hypothetical protein